MICLKRNNGRTREWLPIDIPAPGPCSPPLPCPFPPNGALCQVLCGYSSLHCLLWDCTAYYIHMGRDLSTIICPSGANRPGTGEKMPTDQAVRTEKPSLSPPYSPLLLYNSMLYCTRDRHSAAARPKTAPSQSRKSVHLCRHNLHPARGQ